MITRQPIVVVLGHVDHGKTSLLDAIRSTSVQKREAGAITQHIGASEISAQDIRALCLEMLDKMKLAITIPGLLFIDTPGHEAFNNLRLRGGSLADIAILVVDIRQGFQPQTLESLRILKKYKTPFILAATKLDLVDGWKPSGKSAFAEANAMQPQHVQQRLDETMYQLVGRLFEEGIEAERFDRVTDFTKQVLIVPVSAKTGEGLAELLLYITGLSQRFLEKELKIEVTGPGRGTILEVKEEAGLGTTLDMILYDGMISKNDTVMFGTANGAVTTKVRALLKPNLPGQIRAGGEKFQHVESASAACGVKIFAPGLEDAIPGSPILVANENSEEQKKEIESQISSILVSGESKGIVLKVDTLGSAEAIVKLLSDAKISVRKAAIGKVTRKDVIDAKSAAVEDKYSGAVLAFNVPLTEDASQEALVSHIPVFSSKVIYELMDNYCKWVEEQRKKDSDGALETLPLPAKLRFLSGCSFRMKKPAVFGVEVLSGKLRAECMLMTKAGVQIGAVKNMQKDKEAVKEAAAGAQVAISIEEAVLGKDISEGDVLYSYIDKKTADELVAHCSSMLSAEDQKLLAEILGITYQARF